MWWTWSIESGTGIKQGMADLIRTGDGRAKGDPEEEIKSDLKELLGKLERHALEEEDAFFMVEHNI